MSLFDNLKKTKKPKDSAAKSQVVAPQTPVDAGRLADLVLKSIQDGVIIVNKDGMIKLINPSAVAMSGIEKPENALNLDFSGIMKFEFIDGTPVETGANELFKAIKNNQSFETKDYVLVATLSDKKTPVKIVLTPTGGPNNDRIITFRDITKDLEEEGAQAEFVSTASHEMRTPVASIEGYLSLALNPQTATIDARARQYIESAHNASQRLGSLFKDLLDVTKLDDKRIRAKMVPVELTGFVKKFADEYLPKFQEKNINYSFGAESSGTGRFGGGVKKVEQVVYASVDIGFLGEILANLIENAIKYTPVGGAIWVNVQGDGDQALINVTDTGIGIAAEDLQHIFQKFYRADNSQTRTVGGTGLGLYLVKQRTEAMDGKVWAESAFGEGSTFYVSLPRLTADEYEKRRIVFENQRAVQMFAEQPLAQNISNNAARATTIPAGAAAPQPSFDPNLLARKKIEALEWPVLPAQQSVFPSPGSPTRGYSATAQVLQPVQPSTQPTAMPMTQQPVPQAPQVAPQPVQNQQPPTSQPVQPVQQPQSQPVQNNQNIIQ